MNIGKYMNIESLKKLSNLLTREQIEQRDHVVEMLRERYKGYHDPWGFNLDTVITTFKSLLPLYHRYFRVRLFGAENIQDIPYMVASNHTGQVPIDGILITMAIAMETTPPRILHGMVDRFVMNLPFLADFYGQTGAILGDRENCSYLLDKGESILVFPEGVKGVSKNTPDFYKLQRFTNGFFRIAVSKKVPILPVAVVGAEEMFPFVYHSHSFSKQFGLPSIPIMSNYFPLPSPIDIYICKPYEIPDELSADAPDKEIRVHIAKIEALIKEQIKEGLEKRRPFLNSIRKPLEKILKR